MTTKTIGITGQGIVSPAGLEVDSLWSACINNENLISNGLGYVKDSDEQKIKKYVENHEKISPPNFYSKSLYFCLFSITKAMEEAKWSEAKQDDAILLGTTTGMLNIWETALTNIISKADKNLSNITHQSFSSLENEIRKALGFKGKIITFTSACSASTQAYINAYNLIKSGRATRCIVGGVEELGELTIRGFSSLKILGQLNCKPFDQNRSGINLSEGAAFSCIEKVSLSFQGIKLLCGSTVIDSHHVTSPHPDGLGYQKSLQETLELNKLSNEDIDLIHAHGTGSHHNDLCESKAISVVFGNEIPVVSTKGTHGHSLAASGAIEIALSSRMLKEQLILPNSRLEIQDKNISINLQKTPQRKLIRRMVKSTLGFGGINSTLVLGIN